MSDARAVALEALVRIEDGAYANLVVPALLTDGALDERDRAFVTELSYGTTRMRRACDWVLEPVVRKGLAALEPVVRGALRLGTYQLTFLGTPAHAAVSATVAVTPARGRPLVNAVLRRIAGAPRPPWPDEATRLSYPDWIVERLVSDLGHEAAMAALEQMNRPAVVTERPDGYIQDVASQDVGSYVDAVAGMRVADVCAGPGGKATALAERGACVVANDVRVGRARLVRENAKRLGLDGVAVIVGDGRFPPLRAGGFERVLVDAPCSGLGVLRRRPDARWRVEEADVEALAALQRDLLRSAMPLVRSAGRLVFSVCTLTAAETTDIDAWLASECPDWAPVSPAGPPWEPCGRGARILPQTSGSDGMFVLGLRRP